MRGHRVCWHEIDSEAEHPIMANIQRATERRKRVLRLVTNDFISNSFRMSDFRNAYAYNLSKNKHRLVAGSWCVGYIHQTSSAVTSVEATSTTNNDQQWNRRIRLASCRRHAKQTWLHKAWVAYVLVNTHVHLVRRRRLLVVATALQVIDQLTAAAGATTPAVNITCWLNT